MDKRLSASGELPDLHQCSAPGLRWVHCSAIRPAFHVGLYTTRSLTQLRQTVGATIDATVAMTMRLMYTAGSRRLDDLYTLLLELQVPAPRSPWSLLWQILDLPSNTVCSDGC